VDYLYVLLTCPIAYTIGVNCYTWMVPEKVLLYVKVTW